MCRGTGMLEQVRISIKKIPPLSPSRKGGWAKNLYTNWKYWLSLAEWLELGPKELLMQSTNNNIYYRERRKYTCNMQHIRAPGPLLDRRASVTCIDFPLFRRYCRGIFSLTKTYWTFCNVTNKLRNIFIYLFICNPCLDGVGWWQRIVVVYLEIPTK